MAREPGPAALGLSVPRSRAAPARPGPRRAHKLTAEVVAFARQLLDADPSLRSTQLAEAIAERFGITVHPRSVERALARAAAPKSAAEQQ